MWNCGVVMSASFIFCIPCDIVGTFWHNKQEDNERGNWNSQAQRESVKVKLVIKKKEKQKRWETYE